jgi:hypothetical protein
MPREAREALETFWLLDGGCAASRSGDLVAFARISAPASRAGMRQRVMIAMALALQAGS